MAKFNYKTITLITACSLLLLPAFAQEENATVNSTDNTVVSNTSAIDDDEVIVVTATKIAQNASDTVVPVQVVTEKQIEASGAHNLNEVLNSIPGLSYLGESIGNSEPLQMNGFTDEYIKILIDGVPVTTGGSSDFISQIALDNVDHIEVISGSSSALYGSDAIAGVINIITKKNADKPLTFNIQQEGATNKTFAGSTGIAYKGDSLRAEASAGYTYAVGDYDDATYTSDSGNSYDYKNYTTENSLKFNVRSLLGWDFADDRNIKLNGSYSSTDSRLIKSSSNTDGYYDREYTQLNGTASYNWAFDDRQNIEGYFSARRTTSGTNNENFDGSHDDKTKSTFDDFEGEIRYINDLTVNHQLLLGLNTIYSTWDDDSALLKSMYSSFFAQDLIKYGNLQLTPGVRFNVSIPVKSDDTDMDDDEDTNFNVSPQIGARYDLNDQIVLRASLGMGYKEPTFTQKYNDFWKGQGNPDLKPETSYTATLGGDYKLSSALKFTASGYVTYLEDMIDAVMWGNTKLGQGYWGRIYQNYAEVISTGFNVQGNYQMNDWRASLSYNYLYMRSIEDGEYVEMTGKIPHQIKADVNYTVPATNTSLNVNATWYAPTLTSVDDDTHSSDYLVANLRIDQPLLNNALTIYGGVKNFLNNFSFKDASDGADMESTYNTSDGAVFYIGAKYKY